MGGEGHNPSISIIQQLLDHSSLRKKDRIKNPARLADGIGDDTQSGGGAADLKERYRQLLLVLHGICSLDLGFGNVEWVGGE